MIEALVRPFRAVPALFCLLPALAVTLLYRPGTLGALVYLTALLVVLRYGFLLIEERAWGRGREAVTDRRAFNQGFGEPLKLAAVVIVLALVHGAAVANGGAAAGYAALLLANFAAPAMILIIALDGSLVNALTPSRVWAVIARAGFDYLAACFVLALFSLTLNIVLDILMATDARSLRLFVYSACSFYYVLVVFFMMAWLVERRRELIDY